MNVVILICSLLLLAYVFDITSSKTKIPTVIILLALGWFVRQVLDTLAIETADLSNLLPSLGTIGLILIVLEGSLELEISKNNLRFIGKTALMATLPIIITTGLLGFIFYHFDDSLILKDALSNAVPFSIISSAIAIPSVKAFNKTERDFITYESSFSDIIGVILFNFLVFNEIISWASVGFFFIDIILILIITVISTLGLAFFISFVKLHVKFVPIIIFVILLYSITKIFHLPGLIFIMIFGLFLGNLQSLNDFKIMHYLNPNELIKESKKFKEITQEMAFLVRALFFLLFGFLIKTENIYEIKSLTWSFLTVFIILSTRYLILKLLHIERKPVIYIAPRGLITILLALSIPLHVRSIIVSDAFIIQVIILTALLMMFGILSFKKESPKELEEILLNTNEKIGVEEE